MRADRAGPASHPGCVGVLCKRAPAVLAALKCCRFVVCSEAGVACIGRRCRRGAADHEQSQHSDGGKAPNSHDAAPTTDVTQAYNEGRPSHGYTYCNAQKMLVSVPSNKIRLAVRQNVMNPAAVCSRLLHAATPMSSGIM